MAARARTWLLRRAALAASQLVNPDILGVDFAGAAMPQHVVQCLLQALDVGW
jgi:hypothetical protein